MDIGQSSEGKAYVARRNTDRIPGSDPRRGYGNPAHRRNVPQGGAHRQGYANPYGSQQPGQYAPQQYGAAHAPHQAGMHAAMHDSTLIAERRKQRHRRKILRNIAIVLAVLIIGVGAAFGIYAMQLDSKLALDDPSQTQAIDEALVSAELNQPFYALVIGSDSREGSGTSSKADESGDNQRSDVMILVRADIPNRQITMVSIPRDTPLHLDDGRVVKINEAYNIGGAAYTIEAVSELTGVPISHYAEVHFSELQTLVDKLGGVTVDVPIELSYQDALTGETVKLQPGVQTINGQQAQIFARARHEYGTDQDENRQNAVRQLAEAILKEALDRPIYELPGTVLDLADCVGTDMKTADLVSLATAFVGGSGDMTVYSGSGPTDGDINEAAGGLWLCYENPQGWADLMSVVDSGGDPEGMDLSSTATGPAVPTS